MDNNQRFAWLFHKYFDKKCTQAEKDELFDLFRRAEHDDTLRRLIEETWAMELPDHQQSDRTARKILKRIMRYESSVNPPAVLPPVLFPPAVIPHPYPRPYGKVRAFRFWYAAAALFIILSSTIALLRHLAHADHHLVAADAVKKVPVEDHYLILPDGSKVLLHKNAHIDFPSTFVSPTREVTLRGEAYFDIKPGKDPFIVHTGSVTTTVLGTAFNINAYEKNIVVTVTKGKVKVENKQGEYSILKRNEQITVDVKSSHIQKQTVDADAVIAWKKPYFLFNDVTMAEAAAQLQQFFHVTIVFDNPALENCNVTASFVGQESLEQIMTVLSKINNMQYTLIDPATIKLSGEGCQ